MATDLIAQLSDTDEDVRFCAALNLGSLGEEAAVARLIELLAAGTAVDRRVAALVLGKLGAQEAAPALLKAQWKDKDARVREFAAEALGRITQARRAA